ncbi:MAG: PilZ domain-containing protein [Acidobacteria bacterium]|nr:PilZ domain-containing protein [Acidobacteriota bacterium]
MDQRRTRRFQLELPLSVTRSGVERVAFAGVTKNISSAGVLFTTERHPELGGPIEYVITLNHDGPQSVILRCMGKILRSGQSVQNGGGFQVAATLERYEFVRQH